MVGMYAVRRSARPSYGDALRRPVVRRTRATPNLRWLLDPTLLIGEVGRT